MSFGIKIKFDTANRCVKNCKANFDARATDKIQQGALTKELTKYAYVRNFKLFSAHAEKQ